MDKLNSCLYQGQVTHQRFRPAKNKFIYRVFSLCIDLDELPRLNDLRFLSINGFNLFSFHENDHGAGRGQLNNYIKQLLLKRGYSSATHQIKLLCYPRILGYTFNPLSVYFCYNSDKKLEVILYEVNNTFGSRHTYLLESKTDSQSVEHGCEKLMYVSPFMPMDTDYQFKIIPPNDKVAVSIRQTERGFSERSNDPILHAAFTGTRTELHPNKLLSVFFHYPLMTLKVIGAIHWEALKLWRKKLSIQPKEDNVSHTVSWQDKKGVSHYEHL